MEIRKEFKYEMAHIVRNAWSKRCSYNIHGHSYILEVFIRSDSYDNAGMLIDFGLIKKYFNDFIDSFDHSTALWDIKEDKETIKFFKRNFGRVIVTKYPTSAEVQAEMFFKVFINIIDYLKTNNMLDNGEGNITVSRIKVHETKTGYAQYNLDDYISQLGYKENQILKGISFSRKIKEDWKNPEVLMKVLK